MSTVATLLNAYRGEYSDKIDKNELRPTPAGAYRMFQADSNRPDSFLNPAYREAIANTYDRTVEIPVLKLGKAFVHTGTREAVLTEDNANDSAIISPTYVTYAYETSVTYALNKENSITTDVDFAAKMRRMVEDFIERLDNACLANLETNKNQVWGALPTSNYITTGNIMRGALAQQELILGDAKLTMKENRYKGENYFLTNFAGRSMVNQLDKYKVNNDRDLTGETSEFETYTTDNLVNAVDTKATFFMVQKNNLAIINRNEIQTKLPSTMPNYTFAEEFIPDLDMTMGVYSYDEITDQSATITTGERVITKRIGFATDVVLFNTYNSAIATNASPILKANLATS